MALLVEEMSTPAATSSTATVLVVAPATLEAGSTFEAEVDGITFIVTVPEDGVAKGCEFQVPYPGEDEEAMLDDIPIVEATQVVSASALASASSLTDIEEMEEITSVNNNNSNSNSNSNNYHMRYRQQQKNEAVTAFSVPTGQWRYGFCSCLEGFDCCVCLMGWCCTPILMAQVMQRLKLNWFGCPTDNNGRKGQQQQQQSPPVCIVYTISVLLLGVVGWIVYYITYNSQQQLGYIIWCIVALYFVIVFTCARMTIRKRYNLPPTCCDSPGLDDCCSVYWCGCCSAIQMHRHTHDQTKYRYNVISQTGLDGDSPQIV